MFHRHHPLLTLLELWPARGGERPVRPPAVPPKVPRPRKVGTERLAGGPHSPRYPRYGPTSCLRYINMIYIYIYIYICMYVCVELL